MFLLLFSSLLTFLFLAPHFPFSHIRRTLWRHPHFWIGRVWFEGVFSSVLYSLFYAFFSFPRLDFFCQNYSFFPTTKSPFSMSEYTFDSFKERGSRCRIHTICFIKGEYIPLEGRLTFAFFDEDLVGFAGPFFGSMFGFSLAFFLTQFPVRHANTILAVESYSTTPVNLSYSGTTPVITAIDSYLCSTYIFLY